MNYSKAQTLLGVPQGSKDDKPVLAGYVTNTSSSISVETTAKTLLYYAYGIHLQADTLTDIFFNRIEDKAGVSAWVEEFTALWKNDPQTLSKGTYLEPLRKKMAELNPKGNLLDATKTGAKASKASDIQVDANDIRSGLQIHEESPGSVAVTNNYRRRGHAFLYKMKYRDNKGSEHIVLPNVENGTQAVKDFPVDPISAVNSVTGEFGKWVEDKAGESFAIKNGPVEIDLT